MLSSQRVSVSLSVVNILRFPQGTQLGPVLFLWLFYKTRLPQSSNNVTIPCHESVRLQQNHPVTNKNLPVASKDKRRTARAKYTG